MFLNSNKLRRISLNDNTSSLIFMFKDIHNKFTRETLRLIEVSLGAFIFIKAATPKAVQKGGLRVEKGKLLNRLIEYCINHTRG